MSNKAEDSNTQTQDAPQALVKELDVAPTSLGELTDYRVYKPSGVGRVWSRRETIYYYPGDEAMFARVDRYLESINWIEQFSWINNTDAVQQYSISQTTGLTIIQGQEINVGFNLGATYSGMSIGIEYSQRTFSSTETTSSETITRIINVQPRSSLKFFQKRYDFEDRSTFINDAWNAEWNVGPWGDYNPLTTKISRVQIMASEYFTTDSPLPEGPGTVSVTSVSAVGPAPTTRKRENTTERCKRKLVDMGL